MFRVPPRAAPSAVPLRAASSLPAPPLGAPPPFVSAVPQAASTTAAAAAIAVSDALVLRIDSSSSDCPGRTCRLDLSTNGVLAERTVGTPDGGRAPGPPIVTKG